MITGECIICIQKHHFFLQKQKSRGANIMCRNLQYGGYSFYFTKLKINYWSQHGLVHVFPTLSPKKLSINYVMVYASLGNTTLFSRADLLGGVSHLASLQSLLRQQQRIDR